MDVKHWLNSPKGLGLKFKNKYSQVGSNFIRTKVISNPKNPTGTVIFTGDNVYDKYQEFMFFTQIEPLTLVYNPNGTEYIADVSLDEIEKEEIDNKTSTLQVEVSFKRLTRWRRVVLQRNDATIASGKVYTFISLSVRQRYRQQCDYRIRYSARESLQDYHHRKL